MLLLCAFSGASCLPPCTPPPTVTSLNIWRSSQCLYVLHDSLRDLVQSLLPALARRQHRRLDELSVQLRHRVIEDGELRVVVENRLAEAERNSLAWVTGEGRERGCTALQWQFERSQLRRNLLMRDGEG